MQQATTPRPRATGTPARWAYPGALGLVVASVLLSLAVGSRAIPLDETVRALFGGLDSGNATVITSQRIPRTLVGLVAGCALGVAGALMQGHTRNPLADPGLFGVDAGAAFGIALLATVVGIGSGLAAVGAGLAGAGAATVVVVVLGLRSARGGGVVMLAVVGTSMGLLLSALTTALVLLDRRTLDVVRFWQLGSIADRDVSLAPVLLTLVALGLVLALVNSFALDALSLGEDVAISLGHDVMRTRVVGIVAITLLAGTTTAVCGPIGFVGLVAPHVARWWVGHDYRRLVPLSGLLGAVLVLVADVVGRRASTGELEVGVVIAIVGAPVLLALTRRRRLVAL